VPPITAPTAAPSARPVTAPPITAPAPAPTMAKPTVLSSPIRGSSAWASLRSDESSAPITSRHALPAVWGASGDSEAADPVRADSGHIDDDDDNDSVVSFRPLDYRPSSQPVSLPATQDLLTSPATPCVGLGTNSSNRGGSSIGGLVSEVLVPPSPGLALHCDPADGDHSDAVAPMELDMAPATAAAAPTAAHADEEDDDDDAEAAAMRRRMRAAAAFATPPPAVATGDQDDVLDELPDDLPEIAGLRPSRDTPVAGCTASADAVDLPSPRSPRSPCSLPPVDDEEELKDPDATSSEAPATSNGSTGGSSEGRRRFTTRHLRQTARFSPSHDMQRRREADPPMSDDVQRYLQMMRRQSQQRVRSAEEIQFLTEGDLDDSDDEVAEEDEETNAAPEAAAPLDNPSLTAQHHRALQAMGGSERVRNSIVRLRGGTEFFEYTAYLSTLPVDGAAPDSLPVAAPAFVAEGLFGPLQPTLQRITDNAAMRRAALAGGFLEHAVRNRLQWLWDATAAHGASDITRVVTEPAYTAIAELRALCSWLVALCTRMTTAHAYSQGDTADLRCCRCLISCCTASSGAANGFRGCARGRGHWPDFAHGSGVAACSGGCVGPSELAAAKPDRQRVAGTHGWLVVG